MSTTVPTSSQTTKTRSVIQDFRHNPKCLLVCLCVAAVVQGMIFTNVVISTIERRFGWDSTQSGIIAGSYDIGSFLSVIPVTYFGGRKGASKPKFIAAGLFMMGIGSLIFSSPHFLSPRYIDSSVFQNNTNYDTTRFNNTTMQQQQSISDICTIPEDTNYTRTLSKTCAKPREDSLQNYKFVFILGQLFHGVGAAALITLGTTFLDESVSQKMAPIFISIFEASFVFGPAFGYIIGSRLLNIFTEFYIEELPTEINELLPTSPDWIGAWWLGFILIFILSFCIASLMFTFPAKMDIKISDKKQENNEKVQDCNENENVLSPSAKLDYGKLQDLPKTLYGLVKNLPFMGITLGATCDGFLLAGQAAFLPKYLESQFSLTASHAAMIVGSVVVPAGAAGTLLGGFCLKKFNLDSKGAIKLYMGCQLLILPLYFGFLINCPTPSIAGVNVPYPNETVIQRLSQCNDNCDCSQNSQQEFVCSIDDNLSFLSGCHAGCSSMIDTNFYGNCSCLPQSETIVTLGSCSNNDCNYVYLSVILFFQVLFTFMGMIPGLVAGLRSVSPEETSIALGFQTLIARSLGTVPGPIFLGFIIDQTCILWNDVNNGDCIAKGSCKLYDNTSMSHYILIVLLVWRILAFLSFSGALFFAVRKSNNVQPSNNESEK